MTAELPDLIPNPENRKGGSIRTFIGGTFWPLDPRADEVCIEDIAHALSQQCRFAGHTRVHYSVADHSLLVAAEARRCGASPTEELWALLHDASEAYCIDLPRPIKRVVVGYRDAEATVQRAICMRFRLPIEEPTIVKVCDDVLLAAEQRDLMVGLPREVDHHEITPLSSTEAERQFLIWFDWLSRERNRAP